MGDLSRRLPLVSLLLAAALAAWLLAGGASPPLSRANAAECAPQPAGMAAWWRAEGNAVDDAGSNNGALQNGAGFGTGLVGRAFDFNGSNQFVSVPDSSSVSITGSLTIDAWLFLRSYSLEFAPIVSKWNDIGTNDRGYFLAVNAAHQLEAQLSTDSLWNPGIGPHAIVLMSAGAVPLSAWTHVAAVFDSSTKTLTLYINGIASASGVSQFSTIFDNVEPLFIGAGDLGGNVRDFTNGLIDEVEVFHRTLAPAEIQALVAAGPAGKCSGAQIGGPSRAGQNVGGAAGVVGAAAADAAERNRARAAQAAAACTSITAANAQSLAQVAQVNVGDGKQLRWASDGKAFYAIGLNEVSRYDAATLQKSTLYSGTATVQDFNPDSGLAAIQSGPTTILLRDLFQQQDKGTVTAGGQYRSVAISPDSSLLAVSLFTELAVEVRRTSDGAFVRKYTGLQTGSPVFTASFSSDGQSLVWVARALVQVSDLATGTFGPRFEHEDFVASLSIAAGRLATAFGGGLRFWNLVSGAKLADFTLSNGVFQAVLNHDASLAFAGNKSDVGVFDTASKALVADIVKPGALLALSPSECVLLAGTFDGAVSVLVVPAGAAQSVRPPSTGDGGLLSDR